MVQKSNTKALSWELLQTFLAIAEAQSIRQAATALNINHATVSRQLKKLEQYVGQAVFDRSNKGLSLTELGLALHSHALAMAEQYQQLQFFLDHRGDDIRGDLTISLGDSLMPCIAPAVKCLSRDNPGLNIHFSVSNDVVSLDKGEADIALRITDKPPEHLIAIALQSVSVAAFVHRQLLQELGIDEHLALAEIRHRMAWISWQRQSKLLDIHARLHELIGVSNIKYWVGSSAAMLDAVNARMGAAFMMTNYVSEQHDLVEIADSRTELPLKIWLLYHPNSRQSARIVAAVKTLRQQLLKTDGQQA